MRRRHFAALGWVARLRALARQPTRGETQMMQLAMALCPSRPTTAPPASAAAAAAAPLLQLTLCPRPVLPAHSRAPQVEFYFSDSNLFRDKFLSEQVTAAGPPGLAGCVAPHGWRPPALALRGRLSRPA